MATESKEVKKEKKKTPTALKRMEQNEKRRLINKSFKSQIRSTLRLLEEKIESGNLAEAKDALSAVYSVVDKGVKRNILKLNKGKRIKSRYTAKVASKKI